MLVLKTTGLLAHTFSFVQSHLYATENTTTPSDTFWTIIKLRNTCFFYVFLVRFKKKMLRLVFFMKLIEQ